MARPAKIKSAKKMIELWEEYKESCDNQKVLTHDFSSKNSEFVSAELKRSITYTIEGFCVFVGISRQAFYEYYASDERYVDIVTRIREECEVDARKKFELQIIPSQLAGLWMSKYGYTTKSESDLNVQTSEKLDDINTANIDFVREISTRNEYLMATLNPDDPNLDVYKEFINRSRLYEKYKKPGSSAR